MCDTLIAKQEKTNSWLFAKNSDRDPGEPQIIQYCSGNEGLESPSHPEHRPYYDTLQYPQLLKAASHVNLRYKALISRPAWMWGAEMGINEMGVVIGNEAVFAKRSPQKLGLLGMDILRLTLHSAATSAEAVHIIADLIQTFGQGGNGSYSGSLKYYNSFLIADAQSAFVMESAPHTRWVARKVTQRASISNAYTIENNYELGDAHTLASRVNFSKAYASKIHPWFTKGHYRQRTTEQLSATPSLNWKTMATILRYNEGPPESLDQSMRSICMNATKLVKSRTTASMIVEYGAENPLVWFSSGPMPIFNPFLPFSVSQEAFNTSPFADINYGYTFALERTKRIEALLCAQGSIKKHIADEALASEERMRSLVESAHDEPALAQACIACLTQEEAFQSLVATILAKENGD